MAREDTEHRLGWLGTGRMGSALVRRLLAGGCDVAVYNRTKSKADPLAAPVMGNPKVASVGRLTLAVSGPRAAFDTAQPYLDLLGSGATYVGEGELARMVKICHNLFLGVVTQSLAEVTILAQRSGI